MKVKEKTTSIYSIMLVIAALVVFGSVLFGTAGIIGDKDAGFLYGVYLVSMAVAVGSSPDHQLLKGIALLWIGDRVLILGMPIVIAMTGPPVPVIILVSRYFAYLSFFFVGALLSRKYFFKVKS